MAGVIGMRGAHVEARTALKGYKVLWSDIERPFIRPGTGAPVLTVRDGRPDVSRHVFGITRRFASFNARDDRLEESKLWSRMLGKGHGIAPVAYILEWAEWDGKKRPFRIERRDGACFAAPCLTGASWDEKGERAFALCTTTPGDFMARFHDRTICDVPDDLIDVWLRPEAHDHDAWSACLQAPPSDLLQAVPLSPDVGKARHDDAAALEGIAPPIRVEDLDKRGQQTLF